MTPLDQVELNFNETTLTLLNILIGLIMFGVALDIRMDDFRRVARDPRGAGDSFSPRGLLDWRIWSRESAPRRLIV